MCGAPLHQFHWRLPVSVDVSAEAEQNSGHRSVSGEAPEPRSKTAKQRPEIVDDADDFLVPVSRRSEQWRPCLLGRDEICECVGVLSESKEDRWSRSRRMSKSVALTRCALRWGNASRPVVSSGIRPIAW